MDLAATYRRMIGGYLLLSIPAALWFTESSSSVRLFGHGCAAAVPIWQLIALACASRIADVISTVIALESHLLAESAPGLGNKPELRVLVRLGISQNAFIVATGFSLYGLNVLLRPLGLDLTPLLRTGIVVITLVGFAAMISNTVQYIFVGSVEKLSSRERGYPLDSASWHRELGYPGYPFD